MKTKKLTAGALLACILLGGAILSWIGRPRNAVTVVQVKNMVQAEVPSYSSRFQVENFLKSKDIGHTYLDAGKIDLNTESNVARSGIPVKQLSGVTLAIIRDTSRSLFVSGDIQLVFFYDRQGKMIKFTVKEIFTGP